MFTSSCNLCSSDCRFVQLQFAALRCYTPDPAGELTHLAGFWEKGKGREERKGKGGEERRMGKGKGGNLCSCDCSLGKTLPCVISLQICRWLLLSDVHAARDHVVVFSRSVCLTLTFNSGSYIASCYTVDWYSEAASLLPPGEQGWEYRLRASLDTPKYRVGQQKVSCWF